MTSVEAALEDRSMSSIFPTSVVATRSHPGKRIVAAAQMIDAVAIVAGTLLAGVTVTSLAFTAATLVAFRCTRAHRLRLRMGLLDLWPDAARPLLAAVALTLPLAIAVAGTDDLRRAAISCGVGSLAGRAALAMAVGIGRRGQWLLIDAPVVGTGPELDRLVSLLRGHREYGIQPLPCPAVSADPVTDARRAHPTAKALIVMSDASGRPDTLVALRQAVADGIDVWVQPTFAELASGGPGQIETVQDIPLRPLSPHPLRHGGWTIKRLCDSTVAAALLVLLAPLMAAVAIGVRLTSPGPILFRQARVGLNGRTFTMLKFRSFPVDHRDVVHSLTLDACPLRFGRWLRRTSIDELPQLWNVLRGDMSVIGPRPERPHFARHFEEIVPDYSDRHRVPGGITGLAQIHGLWGPTSIEERVRLDNRYIDTWSLWGDIRILLCSPLAVVRKGCSSAPTDQSVRSSASQQLGEPAGPRGVGIS